jgi:hypothetical protein
MVTNRSSSVECSGSLTVTERPSRNTDAASSKVTPCFRAFNPAFCGSQLKTGAIPLDRPLAAACPALTNRENVQGDDRLSSSAALLSDAPGTTKRRPGHFHAGLARPQSAGTIFATALPWRSTRTVSPFSTRSIIAEALLRNSLKLIVFIFSVSSSGSALTLFCHVFEPDAVARPDALSRSLYPTQEARIILQAVIEPNRTKHLPTQSQ